MKRLFTVFLLLVSSSAMADWTLLGTGTAVVVNKDYALTAAHVLEECDAATIRYKHKVFDAEIVALDSTNDLGLLLLEESFEQTAKFRGGQPVRKGDTVVNYGYPLTGQLSDAAKISKGVINALAGWSNDSRHIQYDAPTQPGNSGGAVLDLSSNIVGVVVSILSKRYAEETGHIAQNVNFAVKSNVAEEFLASNGVDFERVESVEDMKTADIAEKAETFTVLVICWEESSDQTATQEVVVAKTVRFYNIAPASYRKIGALLDQIIKQVPDVRNLTKDYDPDVRSPEKDYDAEAALLTYRVQTGLLTYRVQTGLLTYHFETSLTSVELDAFLWEQIEATPELDNIEPWPTSDDSLEYSYIEPEPKPSTPTAVELDSTVADNVQKLLRTKSCSGCNLNGADLSNTDLGKANLSEANLSKANLSKAFLWKANLNGATLTGSNLTETNLSGASLNRANLAGANLREARHISAASFCKTTMPDGTVNNSGC